MPIRARRRKNYVAPLLVAITGIAEVGNQAVLDGGGNLIYAIGYSSFDAEPQRVLILSKATR